MVLTYHYNLNPSPSAVIRSNSIYAERCGNIKPTSGDVYQFLLATNYNCNFYVYIFPWTLYILTEGLHQKLTK